MAAYKDNHIMPKALLKQWNVPGPYGDGAYCYELKSNRTTFYSAEGQRGFSFAIGRYIYVPERNAQRVTTVERWMSGLEDVLGRVLGKMTVRDAQPFRDEKERTMFLMALMLLQYRTQYQLEAVGRHIEQHPEVRENIQDQPGEPDHFVCLENMINAVTEAAVAMANSHLVVNWNPEGCLVISDEPFIGDAGDPLFVVCSPYFFVAITRGGQPGGVSYQECPSAMVQSLNSMIAENGRYWLMGRDEALLSDYIAELLKPKKEGTVHFEWLQYHPNGYTI